MASRGKWQTLPVCERCWQELNGERVPVRVRPPVPEVCVWCRGQTTSGIYARGHVSIQTFAEQTLEKP